MFVFIFFYFFFNGRKLNSNLLSLDDFILDLYLILGFILEFFNLPLGVFINLYKGL